MRTLWASLVLAVASATSLFAAENPTLGKPIMVGFLHPEAERYEAEWRLAWGYYRTLVKNGLQGALVESRPIYRGTLRPDQLYQSLRPFHVIVLCDPEEGVHLFNDDARRRAAIVRHDLERYVSEGGGLLLLIQPVRYPHDEDELFHNALIEGLGVRMLHEGLFDPAHTFLAPATLVFPRMEFFYTANVHPHPTTEGIRRLYLPRYGSQPAPGIEALGLDANWQVVLSGEPTAKSYVLGEDNGHNLRQEGSQKSAPPIAAVRSFGRGRVFAYSMHEKHAYLNYGNRMWPQITESDGDREADKPSDGNRLLINALRWLAEPALAVPELGTHQLAPILPVKFEPSIDFDKFSFGKAREGVRGILGIHSQYSDGRASVTEFARAARQAGLSFIVFNDPLERLTREKFARLRADCAAAGGADFYACPGVEFTDSLGVGWAAWGERVVFPEDSFVDKGRKFPVWDGHRIVCTGRYEALCGFAANAILDYRALRAANAHPANLWWFYRVLPLVYDGNRLVADNFSEFLYALHDLRGLTVDAFTRIRSPDEVPLAARTCTSVVDDLNTARELLNSRCSAFYLGLGRHYVTQGPKILQWTAFNTQMGYPWQKTRGAQRVRVRLEVSAEPGLRDLRVHDADFGLVRRFDPAGASHFAREFEMVHDKQHYLVLEAIDTQGRRAVSSCLPLYCYKSGLLRCGDNLNTLGSSMVCWHPDRNEMPALAKIFEDGFKYTVLGIDSASGVATQPRLWAQESIHTTQGEYPTGRQEMVNKILDVPLGSHNLQIYSATMDQRSERYDNQTRPTPAMGPIARRLGPLELFQRRQTSYALMSRQDYFVTWDYRRAFEGSRDYRGSLVWHEGEIRFLKDLTLRGAVPVPLLMTEGPGGAEYRTFDQFHVTDRDAGTLAIRLEPGREKPYYRQGFVRPGGYCATLNTDLGYYAFFAPSHSEFSYAVAGHPLTPSLVGRASIGLGHDGQKVAAGDVWPYRFAVATLNDHRLSNELMEDMLRAYNLDGGDRGYPYAMKVGRFGGAEFFFTAEAEGNEALLSVGPRDLICDLAFRVHGIEDNGCAAVYVAARKFFRFVSVAGGTAWFQEPILPAAEIWVGNPLVSSDKNVKLTLVIDGQTPGKPPLVEVHNPTAVQLRAEIHSPPHTPLFGGLRAAVVLPAGDSLRFRIVGRELRDERGGR
jgi:hypothetical protein